MAAAFGKATSTFRTDPGPVYFNFEMNNKVQFDGKGKGKS